MSVVDEVRLDEYEEPSGPTRRRPAPKANPFFRFVFPVLIVALGVAVLLLWREGTKAVLDRTDGTVVETRGRAIDLESLGLLAASGLGLLRRHGPIRSYYLRHPQGQLFLFPVGQDTLIVVGRTNLNLGAVFIALAALEEGTAPAWARTTRALPCSLSTVSSRRSGPLTTITCRPGSSSSA